MYKVKVTLNPARLGDTCTEGGMGSVGVGEPLTPLAGGLPLTLALTLTPPPPAAEGVPEPVPAPPAAEGVPEPVPAPPAAEGVPEPVPAPLALACSWRKKAPRVRAVASLSLLSPSALCCISRRRPPGEPLVLLLLGVPLLEAERLWETVPELEAVPLPLPVGDSGAAAPKLAEPVWEAVPLREADADTRDALAVTLWDGVPVTDAVLDCVAGDGVTPAAAAEAEMVCDTPPAAEGEPPPGDADAPPRGDAEREPLPGPNVGVKVSEVVGAKLLTWLGEAEKVGTGVGQMTGYVALLAPELTSYSVCSRVPRSHVLSTSTRVDSRLR